MRCCRCGVGWGCSRAPLCPRADAVPSVPSGLGVQPGTPVPLARVMEGEEGVMHRGGEGTQGSVAGAARWAEGRELAAPSSAELLAACRCLPPRSLALPPAWRTRSCSGASANAQTSGAPAIFQTRADFQSATLRKVMRDYI